MRIFLKLIARILPPKLRYFFTYVYFKKKIPNLISPRDLSEFICRNILLNKHRNNFYLADKYAVRSYVSARGLGNILTKLYGVWDDAYKIDFNNLPNKFALKTNNGCETNIICINKSILDIDQAIEKLNKWLGQKFPTHEDHYNLIKPCIICEEYIEDNTGEFPSDYKFFCFNGKPKFIVYNNNRSVKTNFFTYDLCWNRLDYLTKEYMVNVDIPEPKNLAKMIEYATILSKDIDFVRVDLYDTGDRVIFGEMTLTPHGGWLTYFTPSALKKMMNYFK